MDTPTLRYANLVIRHPWLTVFAALAIAVVISSGARFLSFTNDYRLFFKDDNPQLRAHNVLQNTYTKSDNVLFVIVPQDDKVFTRRTLSALRELTEGAWQIPNSIRVDSLTNFQHTKAEGDDLLVRDLVEDPADLSDVQLAEIRDIALKEPRLLHNLISANAATAGINVIVQAPEENVMRENARTVTYARQLVNDIEAKHPHIKVHLTGMVMMNAAFSEASRNDVEVLLPLTFAAILLSLAVLLRGWTGAFSIFWVIVLSITSAMGVAGWRGIVLTPPMSSVPIIVLTLAVANAVHVLVTFFQQLRKDPDKRKAMLESLRVNMQPVFLTSFTTALGFLSMNFSESPPFHDLGNTVAAGVMLSFLFATSLLPALMMILPVRTPRTHTNLARPMEKLADFVIRRRRVLLPGVGLVMAMLVTLLPLNELNDEWVKYFAPEIQFRQDTDIATERLTGIYRINYSLNADGPGGISEPAFLAKLDAFAEWYRAQPETVHVNVITDMFKRLSKNMHGDDPSWYKLPEERELAAQYLLLYEMSLPYGLDLNDQINIDKSATRLGVTLHNISVNQLIGLDERAQDWLRANAPRMRSEGSGTSVMFAHIGRKNINSMLLGTTLALVMISGILIVALRSLRIGLISLLPNLLPAAVGFGLWGLLVGEVGMALAVVAGLTLGIIVDDSVHFLSKYLRAKREHGLSPEAAVRYAFSTVGMALLFTSLVLAIGFMVLAMSAFRMNSDLGLLTAIIIVIALVADFLFLPPLLMKLDRQQESPAPSAPLTSKEEAYETP